MFRKVSTFSGALWRVLPALLVLVIALAGGCRRAPNIAAAHVTGEEGNAAQGEYRVFFLPDAEPVICAVTLAGVRGKAALSSRWYFVPRETIVHETSQMVDKDGGVLIKLNRTSGDSETGLYKIELSLENTVQTTLYFRVEDELPPPMTDEDRKKFLHSIYNVEEPEEPAEAPILSEFNTARSIYELTQAPKEIAETFPSTVGVIYLTMLLTNAPEDTRIKVEWYFLGDPENPKLIIPAELPTSGTRQLAFSLKPGTGDLPAGAYVAIIIVNSDEFKRVPFKVVALAESGKNAEANEAEKKKDAAGEET